MNKLIKTITLSIMLLFSVLSVAELPSWGMTENQYKQPNFSNKMSEIGAQANKNNWMLKVTAPNGWHNTIKDALTKTGERDVQFTFKDSLYQSISISAVTGAKIADISASSSSNNTTTQKQVLIDRPEVNNTVEAPDFGDTDFNTNNKELLESINAMEIAIPTTQTKANKTIKQSSNKAVKTTEQANTVSQTKAVSQPKTVSTPQPKVAPLSKTEQVKQTVNTASTTQNETQKQAVTETDKADIDVIKEALRKRYARSKRVEKQISYNSITEKDELYIEGTVVLIKRFLNRGVAVFYWMSESYNPNIHKLVETGAGKFQKDPNAIEGDKLNSQSVEAVIKPINLDFIAIDTAADDQDELRADYIRNKRVEYTITANKLKTDDILYVKNQTVLVERPLTRARSNYYWLVGETIINQEVERQQDNVFVVQ